MDLGLNNLQRLICNKTQINKQINKQMKMGKVYLMKYRYWRGFRQRERK